MGVQSRNRSRSLVGRRGDSIWLCEGTGGLAGVNVVAWVVLSRGGVGEGRG